MEIKESCLDELNLVANRVREGDDIYINTLELIEAFHEFHDNMPTIRELGLLIDLMENKKLGTTGTNTVNRRLDVLEARGDLVRESSCFSGDKRVRMRFPREG